MNIKHKITAAAALGTLAASILMPATSFAATSVKIKNNGAGSKNGVAVVNKKKNVVSQTNTTSVGTLIGVYSNTGKNSVSFNTGGTNSITTGDTITTVGVNVTGNGNTNTANEDCGCTCTTGDTTVDIVDNGAFSWNGALVVNKCKDVVVQNNTTIVETGISVTSKTGGNSTSFNVDGDNTITTGTATTEVGVVVEGGTNTNN